MIGEEIMYVVGFLVAILGGSYVVKASLKDYEVGGAGLRGAGNAVGMVESHHLYSCLSWRVYSHLLYLSS